MLLVHCSTCCSVCCALCVSASHRARYATKRKQHVCAACCAESMKTPTHKPKKKHAHTVSWKSLFESSSECACVVVHDGVLFFVRSGSRSSRRSRVVALCCVVLRSREGVCLTYISLVNTYIEKCIAGGKHTQITASLGSGSNI